MRNGVNGPCAVHKDCPNERSSPTIAAPHAQGRRVLAASYNTRTVADGEPACKCRAMEYLTDDTAEGRLYLKGLSVRYERHTGLWMPIMWHLALRGHAGAMIELADWYSADDSATAFGKPADPFSPAGLYYRAYLKGQARAAINAAMSCFNRNDMIGYRQWLRRAATAGDAGAQKRLRYFETRLWHSAARKVGRLRPEQKRDEFA